MNIKQFCILLDLVEKFMILQEKEFNASYKLFNGDDPFIDKLKEESVLVQSFYEIVKAELETRFENIDIRELVGMFS